MFITSFKIFQYSVGVSHPIIIASNIVIIFIMEFGIFTFFSLFSTSSKDINSISILKMQLIIFIFTIADNKLLIAINTSPSNRNLILSFFSCWRLTTLAKVVINHNTGNEMLAKRQPLIYQL